MNKYKIKCINGEMNFFESPNDASAFKQFKKYTLFRKKNNTLYKTNNHPVTKVMYPNFMVFNDINSNIYQFYKVFINKLVSNKKVKESFLCGYTHAQWNYTLRQKGKRGHINIKLIGSQEDNNWVFGYFIHQIQQEIKSNTWEVMFGLFDE
jgi:hypothetical protein